MTTVSQHTTIKRRKVHVQGMVQGVGFRPFVYDIAMRMGLVGFVRNDADGVTIEIEGDEAQLHRFFIALTANPPPMARIESVVSKNIAISGGTCFQIVPSEPQAQHQALVVPDLATCDACLIEMLNPNDRRHRYAFINCTNCGPRFTIIQNTPYDRERTSMRAFVMCKPCAAEYRDPANRRFHAQPNACPTCGPQLSLTPPQDGDPVEVLAQDLADGAIVALKGLGGFHLACDALNETAVTTLRQRKYREEKPFALMVANMDAARKLCLINDGEEKLLQSPRRPIVLLKQRRDSPIAEQVAPGYDTLGLMLPYTPLHTLLLHDFAARIGPDRVAALVMTSGNLSSEPIVYRNDEAYTQLAPIAERILTHNRDILIRCDDSVTRSVGGGQQMLRRSRGYAPEPITLKQAFSIPVLAVGGQMKSTFCLGKHDRIFMSQHIGDLDNLETLAAFRQSIDHFARLFDIKPQAVAYDLHPDYLSTTYAATLDVPGRIGVQHHHAHIASVLAEHGITEKVIGIAADGTGYGSDGTIWGGEVLIADLAGFERVAHLATFPLPGGEQAILQPWRVGAVLLHQAFGDDFLSLNIPFVQQLDQNNWQVLAQMMERKLNSPQTSSMGRLFDAISALLTLRATVTYEGQAAIELELLAEPVTQAYPFEISDGAPMQMGTAQMIRAIVADIQGGVAASVIAGKFHRTLAEMLVRVCERVSGTSGLRQVAMSGGVFQNRLLLEQTTALLEGRGFTTLINRLVPPNDGGLSLGQAAVAARNFAQG